MAVLLNQVKVRDTEMKNLIGAARDGAKKSSTAVASFEPFDSTSELWLDYLERVRTFLTTNSIPREKEAQVTNQTTGLLTQQILAPARFSLYLASNLAHKSARFTQPLITRINLSQPYIHNPKCKKLHPKRLLFSM